uniref:Uncharacterized protein n=1 Tax=Megaselia scalaris TaxID=36166 RepID=T1GI39_MEGSC
MKPNQQSFLKRNLVTIVVVPGLLLAHYGWWKLQYNDKLVSEEERIDMPIFDAAKKVWNKLSKADVKTSAE